MTLNYTYRKAKLAEEESQRRSSWRGIIECLVEKMRLSTWSYPLHRVLRRKSIQEVELHLSDVHTNVAGRAMLALA